MENDSIIVRSIAIIRARTCLYVFASGLVEAGYCVLCRRCARMYMGMRRVAKSYRREEVDHYALQLLRKRILATEIALCGRKNPFFMITRKFYTYLSRRPSLLRATSRVLLDIVRPIYCAAYVYFHCNTVRVHVFLLALATKYLSIFSTLFMLARHTSHGFPFQGLKQMQVQRQLL